MTATSEHPEPAPVPSQAPAPPLAEAAAGLRRCIVSGRSAAPQSMLRFVVDPDHRLVPDIARRLPGRGIWTDATAEAVSQALARNLFARAARRPLTCAADLPQLVERQLHDRVLDLVGLARRAGCAVAGMSKVEDLMRRGRVGLVLIAGDAGGDGRKHLGRVPTLDFADAAALGSPFGRAAAVYVAIVADPSPRGFVARIAAAVARWQRYRGASAISSGN